MILTLNEVKLFLKVDYEEEDNYIQLLIDAAENYIQDAIDNYDTKILNTRFKNKAKIVSLALINEAYSNRELITKDDEKYKLIIKSFLLQMQYCIYE